MKEQHKAVPAVYLFLIDLEDRILLGLRQNTGYQDGNWSVPSGHVEPGELPLYALLREVSEEIGLSLTDLEVRFVHVMYRAACDETGERVDFFFDSVWNGHQIVNGEPHKCAEWRWFPVYDLPSNITPHVKVAILESLRGSSRFTELGAEFF